MGLFLAPRKTFNIVDEANCFLNIEKVLFSINESFVLENHF